MENQNFNFDELLENSGIPEEIQEMILEALENGEIESPEDLFEFMQNLELDEESMKMIMDGIEDNVELEGDALRLANEDDLEEELKKELDQSLKQDEVPSIDKEESRLGNELKQQMKSMPAIGTNYGQEYKKKPPRPNPFGSDEF